MRGIRGILFDKDGTLLDFDATWGPATRDVLTVLSGGDLALFEALARACGFLPESDGFRVDSPIIGGDTTEFAPAFAALLDQPADAAFADRVNRLYRTASLRHLTAYADVAPVLAALAARGIPVGLATNDSEATALAHLDALEIRPAFAFVAGYDSGWGGKPEPGMVTAFAAAAGLSPDRVALIGDSPHDMGAARRAGARAVGIARTERARLALGAAEPDVLIASLDELLARLDAAEA